MRYFDKEQKPSPRHLEEGRDYYTHGELVIFTERYHLGRGYCCKNDCRHCPYRDKLITKTQET